MIRRTVWSLRGSRGTKQLRRRLASSARRRTETNEPSRSWSGCMSGWSSGSSAAFCGVGRTWRTWPRMFFSRPTLQSGGSGRGESEADFLDRYVEKGYLSGGGEEDDRLAARDLAERILATLSPKDRLAITLREVNGFEVAQIARSLDCSRAAAKVRLFRARRAMQAALRRLIRQDEQDE